MFCIFLALVVTVLVVLGKLTGADWITYTKWLAITLVASKTVTGAVETMAGKPQAPAPPAAPST